MAYNILLQWAVVQQEFLACLSRQYLEVHRIEISGRLIIATPAEPKRLDESGQPRVNRVIGFALRIFERLNVDRCAVGMIG